MEAASHPFVILRRPGTRKFRGQAMNDPIPGVCLAKDGKEPKVFLRFLSILRETSSAFISSSAAKNPLGYPHSSKTFAAPAGFFAALLMNGPQFVIARAAKPAVAIHLDCFVATLLQ